MKKGKLLEVTKKCLYLGIEQAQSVIALVILVMRFKLMPRGRFSVVRDFTGHGIGPTIHEPPHVPHFGLPNKGVRLKEGMVITIEPMINEGSWQRKMERIIGLHVQLIKDVQHNMNIHCNNKRWTNYFNGTIKYLIFWEDLKMIFIKLKGGYELQGNEYRRKTI